jgi:hypothetical protein
MVAHLLLLSALDVPSPEPLHPVCRLTGMLGYFTDSAAARVLPHAMKAPKMPASLEMCASLVAEQIGSAAMPRTLLSVEAGKQCWWGASNGGGAVGRSSGTAAPASDCALPCAGNATQRCGGEWRMELYAAVCDAWAPRPNFIYYTRGSKYIH